ncbi:MAG TPA: methyltransferase domain-containing protein [Candidatus Limnocylindrales bacterium]|nr:methyltransferase domain-containing protein [Candidatus Limnocylindrales bacterium]
MQDRPVGLGGSLPTIFWLSVLGLYLELLLIRWIGTEVRIFAYLQNTVLVVCFLGLGAGLFSSRKGASVTRMLGALAMLVLALLIPWTREAFAHISDSFSLVADVNIWSPIETEHKALIPLVVGAALLLTLVMLAVLIEVFVPMGRWLGREMDEAGRPLVAYSVNVAGSLVGTLLFVAVSVASQPPWVWFVILAVLMLPLLRHVRLADVGLLAVIAIAPAVASHFDTAAETLWSPYQKLVLEEPPPEHRGMQTWEIRVNNVGYQGMYNLAPDYVAAHPELFPPADAGLSQYDIPTLLHPKPDRVLVVGAGSGNDVAGALRGGARSVTAVEIDPAILDFGRRLHPEKPYDDPRVTVVNDDARAYFATTDERFDVIVFGLLDSHTTTSMTNARLDHYVYTQESIDRVRSLLAPGGIVVLSFEAFKPFLRDRIANTLTHTFGAAPEAFRIPYGPYGWGGVLFVAGDRASVAHQLAANPRLSAAIAKWKADAPLGLTGTVRPATDDWPYLYLAAPTLPPLHLLLAGLAALLVVYLRVAFGIEEGLNPMRWSRADGHFAAMGAAFLLLEVQNISKASVVLGNTWDVNAVIISAVLVMVLLANALAPRLLRIPTAAIYVVLLATIGGLWFVDLAVFAFLPYLTKAVLVGVLTTLPMLFSGLIFARSFTAADGKDKALGANLLGSLAGALLQSVSFLIGLRSLLVLVGVLYAISWRLLPQKMGTGTIS